jgi:hypothetical protein
MLRLIGSLFMASIAGEIHMHTMVLYGYMSFLGWTTNDDLLHAHVRSPFDASGENDARAGLLIQIYPT